MDGAHGPDDSNSHSSHNSPHTPGLRDGRQGAEAGSLYLRATLSQWRLSHAEVASGAAERPGAAATAPPAPPSAGEPGGGPCLTQASVHAVLARLRRFGGAASLVESYEASPAADFALIASLLPLDPDGEAEHLYALCRVREAAYWIRWLELQRAGGSPGGSPDGSGRPRA